MSRVNTKSVINVLGTVQYRGSEIVDIFNKIPLNYEVLSNIKYYDEYIILDIDRWDTISQKFYGSPNLYWLILAYNKIKDPFASLVVGNKIKIIKMELLPNLLIQLRGY